MVWIDRAGVFWLVIVWGAYAAISGLGVHNNVSEAFTYPGILVPAILAGLPWLFLRGLFWVATGRITE